MLCMLTRDNKRTGWLTLQASAVASMY